MKSRANFGAICPQSDAMHAPEDLEGMHPRLLDLVHDAGTLSSERHIVSLNINTLEAILLLFQRYYRPRERLKVASCILTAAPKLPSPFHRGFRPPCTRC
jgi:hypothetical protein